MFKLDQTKNHLEFVRTVLSLAVYNSSMFIFALTSQDLSDYFFPPSLWFRHCDGFYYCYCLAAGLFFCFGSSELNPALRTCQESLYHWAISPALVIDIFSSQTKNVFPDSCLCTSCSLSLDYFSPEKLPIIYHNSV
jgi:hypothetical protein